MTKSLTDAVSAAEIVAATEIRFAVGTDRYEAVRDCAGFADEEECASCDRDFARGAGWMAFDGGTGTPVCDADFVAWLLDPTKSDALPTDVRIVR